MKKSWTKNSHQILEQATKLENYNRWLVSLFQNHFGNKILEIGSGLGGLSILFPKTNVTLSDISDDYFNYLKRRFGHKTIKLDIEKEIPPSLQNSFDTIFSSNVLEHIEDDQRALNNCYKLLQKNCQLLVFVPAMPKIYGSLDKAMGHFRRYTKKELAEKVTQAGFKITSLKYVNFLGSFTWWLRGLMPSQSKTDSIAARLFDSFLVTLLYLERRLSLPFGQSLMLIAEKS